jgi:hypothetical protein
MPNKKNIIVVCPECGRKISLSSDRTKIPKHKCMDDSSAYCSGEGFSIVDGTPSYNDPDESLRQLREKSPESEH